MIEEKIIDCEGIRTNFVSIGKKNSRKFIMLHGWGGSLKSFLGLGKKLAKILNIEILIPDLPGFGKSSNPPIKGWSTNDYEKWLETFLKKTTNKNDEIFFYGHSFGCRLIIRFLLKNPKFLNKVILTGAAGINLPKDWRQKILEMGKKMFKVCSKFTPKKVKNLLLKKVFKANDWVNCSDNLKNTLMKVVKESDFRQELEKIKTPILLIWGKNDTYTKIEAGKIFAKKLPNSTLEIFKTGRHGIHYTHEKEILKLVKDFYVK